MQVLRLKVGHILRHKTFFARALRGCYINFSGRIMKSVKEQVSEFLKKCEQLRGSKFIMATTRVKDLLKCIVNSPVLYQLFQEATSRFDYISAKRRCFVTTHEGFYNRGRLVLPENAGERLSFIFCLLVEFDHDTINFNEFLLRFYPEDGGYYASFRTFCNEVIVSLENIVRELFRDELQLPGQARAAAQAGAAQANKGRPKYDPRHGPGRMYEPHGRPAVNSYGPASFGAPQMPTYSVSSFGIAMPSKDAQNAQGLQSSPVQSAGVQSELPPRPVPGTDVGEKLSAVSMLIAYERDVIGRSLMPDGEKQNGLAILDELEAAVRESRPRTVYALLRGYEYYSACHNNFSQLSIMLRSTLGGK